MLIEDHLLKRYCAQLITIKLGEVIFKEGGIARFYYQLKSGSVKWYNQLETGDELLQMMVYPGDCFGEIALFDQKAYAASAVAHENCEIWVLDIEHFKKVLADHPEIQELMMKRLAERIRYKFVSSKAMAFINADLRITQLFDLFKAERTNIDPTSGKLLLTRQELADMTALRVETVIRTLRKLKETGKLRIERGKVYI